MFSPRDFEEAVRAGYYLDHRESFRDDHEDWLIRMGVPMQHASRVASYAWEHGHAYGHTEVLNVSYDLIRIFTG